MSNTKNTGGPAFPHSTQEWASPIAEGPKCLADVHYPGMTLRDWCAGQAMVGILGNLAIADKRLAIMQREYFLEQYGNVKECDAVAMESYKMADAMLKAREQ